MNFEGERDSNADLSRHKSDVSRFMSPFISTGPQSKISSNLSDISESSMQFDRSCSWQNTLNERRFQNTLDQIFEMHKRKMNESPQPSLDQDARQVSHLQKQSGSNILLSPSSIARERETHPYHFQLSKCQSHYRLDKQSEGHISMTKPIQKASSKSLTYHFNDQKTTSKELETDYPLKTAKSQEKGTLYKINLERIASQSNLSKSFVPQDTRLEDAPFNICVQDKNMNRSKSKIRLRHFHQYNKCIILPDDPWKLRWNLFLVVIIWLSSILTPLHVAFFDQDTPFWIVTETFIDVVFFIDIGFSFVSAYYNKMEILIDNRKKIACGYIKGWFFIDLLAIFPLQLLTNNTINQLGKMARLPRVYKLMKTAKFLRNTKIIKTRQHLKKRIAQMGSSIEAQRLIEFSLLFMILCHTLSCMWFLVAKLEDFHEETWVTRYGYNDSTIFEQYLAGLYFIVATITTVGYGDISGKSTAEQGFGIILMIIGVIAYSTAISSFMSIMTASDKRQQLLRAKLNTLSRVRDQYNLNFELYWRLRQSLHYDHSMDMTDKRGLLKELPGNLKIELSNIMYSQQLHEINYFKKKSPKFVATVAPLLKPQKVCKGEYIYLKGDSLDAIYFIKKGQAAYFERRGNADLSFANKCQGSYFGQLDFAASSAVAESKRIFAVKAMTDMDLLILQKEDLLQIDQEFKQEVWDLFSHSHKELEEFKKMLKQAHEWLKKKQKRKRERERMEKGIHEEVNEEDKSDDKAETSSHDDPLEISLDSIESQEDQKKKKKKESASLIKYG